MSQLGQFVRQEDLDGISEFRILRKILFNQKNKQSLCFPFQKEILLLTPDLRPTKI